MIEDIKQMTSLQHLLEYQSLLYLKMPPELLLGVSQDHQLLLTCLTSHRTMAATFVTV